MWLAGTRKPYVHIGFGLTLVVFLITATGLAMLGVAIYYLSEPILLDSQRGYVDVVCSTRSEITAELLQNAKTTMQQFSLRHNFTQAFVSHADNTTRAQLSGLVNTMLSSHHILAVRTYMANGTQTSDTRASGFDTSVNYGDLFPLDQEELVEGVIDFFDTHPEPYLSGPSRYQNSSGEHFYAYSLTILASDRILPQNSTLADSVGHRGLMTGVFLGSSIYSALSARDSSRSQSPQFHVGQGFFCSNSTFDDENTQSVKSLMPADQTVFVGRDQMAAMQKGTTPLSASLVNDPNEGRMLVVSRMIDFPTNSALYIVVRQHHRNTFCLPFAIRDIILITCFSVEGGLILLTQFFSNLIVRRIVRLKMAAKNERVHLNGWLALLLWPLRRKKNVELNTESEFFVPEKVPLRKRRWRDEIDEISNRFNEVSDMLSSEYAILNARVMARRSEIEDAQKAANEANSAKSRFLARITHELRTPLHGIIGTATVSLGETDRNVLQKNLRIITRCGELLLRLLMDLIFFSENRVENGFEENEFTVDEFADQLIAIFGELCARKKAVLLIEAPLHARGCILLGDSNCILQILYNLVSNGIRYTPHDGKLICRMKVSHEEGKMRRFMFEAQDEGPGISPEQRDAIFEEFTHDDDDARITSSNTGLGLYISRQLAERMGGTLTLQESVEKGSKFVLEVPIKLSMAKVSEIDGASPMISSKTVPAVDDSDDTQKLTGGETLGKQKSGSIKALSALIVDDNNLNLMVLKRMLFLEGVSDITLAQDGFEAIEKVRSAAQNGRSFDIIFMDIQMPKMDGRQTTVHLRTEEGFMAPIIAVSAYASDENAERCKKSGMNTFLVKPVKRASIKKIVNDMRYSGFRNG